MAALRDQRLSDFVVADASNLPVVPPDRWIVLVDDNRPVSAIAPATRLDPARPGPAIIVAPADLDVDAALASEAFAEAADVSAVVLVDGGTVAGVWGGPSLANAAAQRPARGAPGSVLPGTPTIPVIVRSCTFTDGGTICATASSFPGKPFPMPACPNARHLSAHDFHGGFKWLSQRLSWFGRIVVELRGRPPVPRVVRARFWDGVRSGLSLREAAAAAGVRRHLAEGWFREAGGVAGNAPRAVPVAG